MKVREVMVREVRSCCAEDSLNRAAQIMWDGDCGVVPVVDGEGRPVGMITDRDICMAAYTQGLPITMLRVGTSMVREVASCSPDATLETAMALMKEGQVRRLPITDGSGKLVGILSLNDLAREARRRSGSGVAAADLADTLGRICEDRSARTKAPPVEREAELVGAGPRRTSG